MIALHASVPHPTKASLLHLSTAKLLQCRISHGGRRARSSGAFPPPKCWNCGVGWDANHRSRAAPQIDAFGPNIYSCNWPRLHRASVAAPHQ